MQYNYYSDGLAIFREGIRSGSYVLDHTLTALGFAGLQNTDWENILTIL